MTAKERNPITFIDGNGLKFDKQSITVSDPVQKRESKPTQPASEKKTSMRILQLNEFGKIERSTIE